MNPDTTASARSGTSYSQLTRNISARLAQWRQDAPAVMKCVGDLGRTSMASGALSTKTKELIALALGVATHCDACIGYHAKALVGLDTTELELQEALAVAVYMGGGPSLMYSARALDAFREFSEIARRE